MYVLKEENSCSTREACGHCCYFFSFFFSIAEKRRSARFRRRSFSSRDLKDLHDGKDIYETLTQASDPDSVKVSVSVMRFCFSVNNSEFKSY